MNLTVVKVTPPHIRALSPDAHRMHEDVFLAVGPGLPPLQEAPGPGPAVVDHVNDLDHDPDDRSDKLPPRPPFSA